MKRLLTIILATLFFTSGTYAQQTQINSAASKYRAANTLTADVRQTRHNAAMTKDDVCNGHLYYKKTVGVSMVFTDTKQMLLMAGDTFTMVSAGKQSTTKANGKGNNPFEVLSDVLGNLLANGDFNNLTKMADVKANTQGNTCTLTVTPVVSDPKMKRRMMYTSCVVTIDLKAGELRTVRINERGENYTQYDFSGFVFNANVSGKVFDPQTVM
ncbi:MAG: outer membrane lipoprotein carrier protein LolA [Prevotella sp.]|nr:outer membrane lipoprotein carrier protein LolA [Prevotella sp.]